MDDAGFALFGLFCSALGLGIPVTALVLALQAGTRLKRLEQRVADLEVDNSALRRQLLATPTPAPAPAPAPEPESAPKPVDIAARVPLPVELNPGPPPKPVAPRVIAPSTPEEEPEEAPRPREPWSFERVAVWLAAAGGGGAVVLAGLYFFALAIQEGWVSPGTRYMLGLLLGAGMVGGAEILWARRYRVPAAGVTGAGIGVLYGALYAGVELYSLLPHSVTFVLMALVTATATALANRHESRFLAVLGALGGFATPLLLSTGDNRAVALFVYLAILDVGLLFTSLRQRWPGVAVLAAGMTLLFQVGWGIQFNTSDQLVVAFVASVGLGGLFCAASLRDEPDTAMSWATLGGGLGVLLLGPLPFVVPLGHDVVATDGLFPAMWILGAAAGALAVTTTRGWTLGAAVAAGSIVLPQLMYTLSWAGLASPPRGAVLAVLVVPALVAWGLSLRRSSMPVLVAYLGTVLSGLLVLLADEGLDVAGELVRWPLIAQVSLVVGLGLVLSFRPKAGPLVAVALGYAALALGGVAWMWADEGAGLTLLLLSGAAWAAFAGLPFAMSAARQQPGPFAWGTAALSGGALFLPMFLGWRDGLGDAFLGGLPLLLGAGSLAGVAWLVREGASDEDRNLALFAGATLLFAALVLPLQVEREWLTIGWSLQVAALAWLSGRLKHALIPTTAGILALLVCCLLLLNPEALRYHAIEGPILFNWILYTWGVPAAALLYAAVPLQRRVAGLGVALMLGGIALLFALVNLEVAHAFAEGGQLSFWSDDLFEEMTRSISWAAFGIGLLISGIVANNRMLRVLAFGFLLLSASKVFLIDLWSLSGLARVGSIMGLGVFLLFAALLFQRVVLREEQDAP